MKEKIIEQLRAQYANYSLGEKALNGLADFAMNSVESEEDIEDVIKSLSGLAKSFQGEADQIRTAKTVAEKKAAELEEQLKALKDAKPAPVSEPPANSIEERLNAMQRMFEEKLGATQTELQSYKNAEVQAKRVAFINSKATELNIPQSRIEEGFNISTDADETAITEYLSKVAENVVALQVQNQGRFQVPRTKEVSIEEGEQILKRIQR